MNNQDKKPFFAKLVSTGQLYGKEISPSVASLYFNVLIDYTIDDFERALAIHLKDPDKGQFMPKPADLIAAISGTKKASQEDLEGQANMEWMQVRNKISSVGSYGTPKFDDPCTVECVNQLGGWVALCGQTVDQLVWTGKSFVRTYQDIKRLPQNRLPKELQGRESIADMRSDEATTLEKLFKKLEVREL